MTEEKEPSVRESLLDAIRQTLEAADGIEPAKKAKLLDELRRAAWSREKPAEIDGRQGEGVFFAWGDDVRLIEPDGSLIEGHDPFGVADIIRASEEELDIEGVAAPMAAPTPDPIDDDDPEVAVLLRKIWGADGGKTHPPLSIDDEVERLIKSTRAPRLRPELAATDEERKMLARRLVRRALEVGLYTAFNTRRAAGTPIADGFDTGANLAATAERALGDFIKWLEPNAVGSDDLAAPIRSCWDRFRAAQTVEEIRRTHDSAVDEAAALWRVQALLKELKGSMRSKERAARKGVQNPGKPDQRAFARVLAEAWIFLTGRVPGANPEPGKNPFLRFLSAGWSDLFGVTPDGRSPIGALNASRKWTNHEIERIKKHGPWREDL